MKVVMITGALEMYIEKQKKGTMMTIKMMKGDGNRHDDDQSDDDVHEDHDKDDNSHRNYHRSVLHYQCCQKEMRMIIKMMKGHE